MHTACTRITGHISLPASERQEAGMSRRTGRITAWIALIGLLVALAAALLAPQADAATVQSGSLTMTSDEGDYVGGGQQYAYDTNAGDAFRSFSSGQVVSVDLQGADGDHWNLDFAAPQGETLAVGTYDGATRHPFQDPADPGLAVYGAGRGCNASTGSFTVTQIAFAPGGGLESFDADFVQHCEGAEAALRGHVHVVPVPPLSLALDLDATGVAARADGTATVGGTVTCSAPTTLWLWGTLKQRSKHMAGAWLGQQVMCSGTTRWQATVRSDTAVAFSPGPAQLSVTVVGFDSDGELAQADQSATVRLTR